MKITYVLSDPVSAAAITVGSSIGTKMVTSFYNSNKLVIDNKIKEIVFRKKWNFSVYFTKYFKFKKFYELEDINKAIVESIDRYKVEQNRDCTYDVDGVLCSILPKYGYGRFDEISEFFEDELYEEYREEPVDVKIPQVESVTITISPLTTGKISYTTYQKIIQLIENRIMKSFDYKRTGSFIYFAFDNEKDLKKMEEHFIKKIRKLDESINVDKIPNLELRIINKPILEKMIATLI